ncbi:hypothetical protein SLE2022_317010 [Rubroshorea leprosula]
MDYVLQSMLGSMGTGVLTLHFGANSLALSGLTPKLGAAPFKQLQRSRPSWVVEASSFSLDTPSQQKALGDGETPVKKGTQGVNVIMVSGHDMVACTQRLPTMA